MRGIKAGFAMQAALLSTTLVLAIAALYLFLQSSCAIVHISMIPISLIAMVYTYTSGAKKGGLCAGALTALLFLLTMFFWREELSGFIFWVVWIPCALFSVTRLRMGVNGIVTERDFYRSECARIAMVDSTTQMRNMHAFLNDAPIYIKIAKRYNLSMMVLVIRLANNAPLARQLEEVARKEMLESISSVLRNAVRLEDLAYFINNDEGLWCLNMFTHPESIDVVINRLKNGLALVRPDYGDSAPCPPEFRYGYASYNPAEDLTPSTLLQRAIDMARAQAAAQKGDAPK